MADAIPVTAEPKAPVKAPKAPAVPKADSELNLEVLKAEAEAEGKKAYFIGSVLRVDS